jgi:hypothetical protein
VAAQRGRGGAVPHLEPRLRRAVGQHVVHALRRSAQARGLRPPLSFATPRESPAA